MAYPRIEMGLALVLVTMLWTGATAQSSCTSVLISLSPCLNYITGNASTPSSDCCTKLASVVQSQPQCLCEALSIGGSSLGLNINETLALGLPSACNVQTPPISSCNAASPANSPAGAPESPGFFVPSGGGSNTVPSTDRSLAAGSSTNLSISLLFFLLFAASYASTFAAQ